MNRCVFALLIVLGILLVGSLGFSGPAPLPVPGDSDNDGVPDAIDLCPSVSAAFFDRNGDGCIDDGAGARHTEFWMKSQMPFAYYINADGAAGITNGSDFTAIQNGLSAWTAVPNVVFSVSYAGTTTQKIAAALDRINLVTFEDSNWPTYHCSNAVLALGISTSFTEPTTYDGTDYLPGQIVDADLIFNPNRNFKTPTAGNSGSDIQSIATHEAGHLYGISHSPVQTSTMFYVLPPGTSASSLSSEDKEIFFKAYGDSTELANANRISGAVLHGSTNDPMPGAIVYAIDAASGDTVAADYTLPDGSYAFPGLADGSYYIAIHPVDGSAEIGGLTTQYINALVDSTAREDFSAEYYDQNESGSDDPADKLAVSVSGGSQATGIDILTNVDSTPPEVASIVPGENATSVKIDAAIKIRFSESMDYKTIQGNFKLRDVNAGTYVQGTASFFNHDSTVAFTPQEPFDFASPYELTLGTGLSDIQHNGLAEPYVLDFSTETMPPLAITSLAPNKGVVGSLVVINGVGFGRLSGTNVVRFGNTQATIVAVYRNRLLVKVPMDVTTSLVTVTVLGIASNGLTFTVLSQDEIARGFEAGVADLSAVPRSIAVNPNGGWAYVATDAGAAAVVVDPGQSSYLTSTTISVPGGLDAFAATPDGKRMYAVSRTNQRLYSIDADPADGILFNKVISERALPAAPLGITIDPSGGRAFVSTDGGGVEVWDVRTASETFEQQIGLINPSEPGIRGSMAIDPTGSYLLVLGGSGKLYTYQLGPDTLYATATVLSDPRDVVVDPTGQHAYVTDGTGNVSIVPLSGLFQKTYDINTGGGLYGETVTPAGHYLYACNKTLKLIDVIDINEESSKARSVVATIEVGQHPADIALSPDGYYAFTVLPDNNQLMVTTIGLGPAIKSLSRRSGPPGTKLVIAGTGFGTTLSDIRVTFAHALGTGPIEVAPELSTGTSLTVTVPTDAGSGPVRVIVTDRSGPVPVDQISNSIYFQVFGFIVSPGTLRVASRIPTQTGYEMSPALAFSATGDFLVVGGYETSIQGELGIFDTDPESPKFNQWINTFGTGSQPPEFLAVTPDGERAYSGAANYGAIICHNVNRHSIGFGDIIDTIDLTARGVGSCERVAVSPDGELLLVGGPDSLYVIDIVPGSTTENKVIAVFGNTDAVDIAFHPEGRYAYLANYGFSKVDVLCLDPTSANYLKIVANVHFDSPLMDPHSIAFVPDGSRCFVLALRHDGLSWTVLQLDTSVPSSPVAGSYLYLGCGTYQGELGVIRVSPQGNRALAAVGRCGYIGIDLTTDPISDAGRINDSTLVQTADFDFTPDGSRIYVASPAKDSLFIYDFNGDKGAYMMMVSGNEQAGIINESLAAPLRVFVGQSDSGTVGIPGVPVTFKVTTGGGRFTESNLTTQVIATNPGGFAEIDWTLGPVVGVQTQRVIVESQGIKNSGMVFIADSYDSPDNLPLRLTQMIPVNTALNVSVTSAVQATFTRAVKRDSITSESFFVRLKADPQPIPVTIGFTDSDRKVSLIPKQALEYGTQYVILADSRVRDLGDGALLNPSKFEFTTQTKPPVTLASVSPPAGTVGASLVLSGMGFDATASDDKVLFNGAEAVPYEAAVNYVKTTVPLGAMPGTVRVVCGTDTSNALPFVVLVPSTSPVDEVLATVNTNSTVKSVAVTPDGALAYSTSPDGDIVIPIDVDGQTTYPSIAVGDDPVAIAIDAEGRYAYVANFNSGSVSVIVVDPDSTRFNQVVQTILVGNNPIDVAASPDGDRVYVANAGSKSVSVIDGDNGSQTKFQVLATAQTTNTVKSVTVTPDGATVYAGADIGYVIIDAQTNAVTATVNVNNSIKSVTVTPDGGLLIALTDDGKVLVIDITQGSSTVNTVLATVNTNSTVKSVAVTPDGALLYIILDSSDKALVYSLNVGSSAGALEPGTPVPPPVVRLAPVDTIPTGHDPAFIAFDRSGSGYGFICNAGDNTITILNATGLPPGPIALQVRVTPRTLNLQSRGRWVTANIEPPSGYWPEEIDVASVLLAGSIHAVPGSAEIVDSDGDGLRELVLKFDRAAFQALLPQGEYVPVTVSGTIRNRQFAGTDTIRTLRPVVTHPNGGVLSLGEQTTITWTSPAGYKVDSVSVHWTPDDGATWIMLAHGIPDTHALPWRAPETAYELCRVMVTLFAKGEIFGMGMSQEVFAVMSPVAVTIQRFSGALVDGAAVLAWSTALEQNIDGFNVLRSEAEAGPYVNVNAKLIASSGGTGSYEFKDEGVLLNRTYYYELAEVSSRGTKVVFGPYALVARAAFELGQNSPNPFNPVTTIKFTIPEDCHAVLAVYDATGRRVRTLVDGDLQAKFYSVQWDGRNDEGRRAASGVYFYRLQAGRHAQAKKMLLLR